MALPTFTPDPYDWPVRDEPDAPWWMRGHHVWNRDYGRRFWPVLGRCVKRSVGYPPAARRRPR